MGANFGKSARKEPVFSNVIGNLFWELKTFEGKKRLNLTLEREGNQYPQWYSAGSGEGLTLSRDGTEIVKTPPEWGLNAGTQAARFLDTLMDACDTAKVTYPTDCLRGFQGLECEFVQEPWTGFGSRPGKNLPMVKSVASRQRTTTEKPSTSVNEEVAAILTRILDEHEGEFDISEIDSKFLKAYTNGLDYAGRKKLADRLSDPAYVGRLEGFGLEDTVVTTA